MLPSAQKGGSLSEQRHRQRGWLLSEEDQDVIYITYLQREAKLKFGKLSKTHKHVQLNSTNVFQTGFGLLADQSKNTFNKIAGKRHTSKTSSYRNQIRQTLLKAAAKHPTLRIMTQDRQLVI